MNIVVTVAAYEAARLKTWLEAFPFRGLSGRDTILIVGTGHDTNGDDTERLLDAYRDMYSVGLMFSQVKPMKRRYASVMHEKIRLCESMHLCDQDTILFNADDDYAYNPHAFEFARSVYEANPDINYMSLLRGPGVQPEKSKTRKINGFTFAALGTSMGGCMTARWSQFNPMVKKFFKSHGVTGEEAQHGRMFGVEYWPYLHRQINDTAPVWVLMEMSLVQHCNMVTYFLNEKKTSGVLQHMYGTNFDPRCDPFEIAKHLEAYSE